MARAGGYASQTYAYADALAAATGKAVGGCFIHLPLAGLVVPGTTYRPVHPAEAELLFEPGR